MKSKSLITPTATADQPNARGAIRRKSAGSAKPNAEIAPERALAGISKQQRCLDLLARKYGANLTELAAETGWQPHSIRGFISGVVRRKLGHTVISILDPDGVRRYRIDTSAARP